MHRSLYLEATLTGAVTVGPNRYIGAGARLRGDWGSIVLDPYVNIQDDCILHVQPEDSVVLGPRCPLGHGAILHGPKLRTRLVVGTGVIFMDEVTIGYGSCVAARALVTSGITVGQSRLLVGVPARDAGEVGDKLRTSPGVGNQHLHAVARPVLRYPETVVVLSRRHRGAADAASWFL